MSQSDYFFYNNPRETVVLGINLDKCLSRFISKTMVFLGQREYSSEYIFSKKK